MHAAVLLLSSMYPGVPESAISKSIDRVKPLQGGNERHGDRAANGKQEGKIVWAAVLYDDPAVTAIDDKVIYVASDLGCSGMYEWVDGESWLTAMERVCGVGSEELGATFQWYVRRAAGGSNDNYHRYIGANAPAVAGWGEEVVVPGDLLVLLSRDYCEPGDTCVVVAGEVLGPGPLRHKLPRTKESTWKSLIDESVGILATADWRRQWLFQAREGGVASVRSHPSGELPVEQGVHILFFDRSSSGMTRRSERDN